jgi:hypothetical protein
LDSDEKREVSDIFYSLRKDSLYDAMRHYSPSNQLMLITTFSRLLTEGQKRKLCNELGLNHDDVKIVSLQQINTEEQFSKRISEFLNSCVSAEKQQILIVQGQVNPDTPNSMAECVRYAILNQVQQRCHELEAADYCVILVLQVPRVHGGFFSGFPGAQWTALHVDELCGDPNRLNVASWTEKSLPQVLADEEALDLRKLVTEAIPKAASIAFRDDDQTSARLVQTVDILTKCFAGNDEVRKGGLDRVPCVAICNSPSL